MTASPTRPALQPFRRLNRLPGHAGTVGAVWTYVLLAAVGLAVPARNPTTVVTIASWAEVPVAAVALSLVLALLRGNVPSRLRQRAWWLVAAAIVANLTGTILWNLRSSTSAFVHGTVVDGLFLFYYATMTGAGATFFASCGGSWRQARFWLDTATLFVASTAALWPFFFGPLLAFAPDPAASLGTRLAYTIIITIAITAEALVAMQIMRARSERHLLLLIGAVVIGLAADVSWFSADERTHAALLPFLNLADVVSFALLSSAAIAERHWRSRSGPPLDPGTTADGFLPVVFLLLAICLLAGSTAIQRGHTWWAQVGLVLLGSVLLLMRQHSAQRELRRLMHAASTREADARLLEITRCSADCITVVTAERRLAFVSSAAESMLELSIAEVDGQPAARLLGTAHETRLAAFIDGLIDRPARPATIEVATTLPSGGRRIVRIVGRNQLDNPRINGITLVLSDVTAERTLERDVLEVSTLERQRLSRDVHEGLGQELTGIALLLQSVGNRLPANANSAQGALREISRYVNRAVLTTRTLAKHLSPLHVVGGSLASALVRLADETGSRFGVFVHVIRGPFEDELIESGTADHLYRVAQESVNNAVRHSGCTVITIELGCAGSELQLAITDDGHGLPPTAALDRGLGLRMMEYRARVMGGELCFDAAGSGGTRVVITAPLNSEGVKRGRGERLDAQSSERGLIGGRQSRFEVDSLPCSEGIGPGSTHA